MIIVLGLDGLEYNLVEEFRLNAIKLKACSKTNLEDFDVVVTPPIWASMLTGKIIKEMMAVFRSAAAKVLTDDSKKTNLLRMIIPLRFRRLLARMWDKTIPKVKGNPMDYTLNFLERNNYHTIFDEATNPVYNKIPGFNVIRKSKLLRIAFMGKDFKDVAEKSCLMKIKNLGKDLLNLMEKDYDLIFWYTNALDNLGHIFFGRKMKTMDYYMRINRLVADIIQTLSDTDKLYIISDHGMKAVGEGGLHSTYGFFSSNTGETIKKPKELYSLLKKNLREEQSKRSLDKKETH
ncbi:MAG: alkaline phosphatase family protein [Promethearchaeota archaeon]|jgi:hypothetical protein